MGKPFEYDHLKGQITALPKVVGNIYLEAKEIQKKCRYKSATRRGIFNAWTRWWYQANIVATQYTSKRGLLVYQSVNN